MKIALPDDNAEIGPVLVDISGGRHTPEGDRLSSILKAFNEHFGTLFTDAHRVSRRIREDIAPKVAGDQALEREEKHAHLKNNKPTSRRDSS